MSFNRPSCCPPRRAGLLACAGLFLLAALCSCGPDPRTLVVISVDGLPSAVQAIRATASLNGQTAVELYTSGLGQFGMRLPTGASGALSLTLEALRADQCAIASGASSVVVSGQNRADVSISLVPLASPSCAGMGGPTFPVTVTKSSPVANPGDGLVTSLPVGISCGATCTAPFAQGSAVSLSVVPAYRSLFVGWSGACTAPGGGCALTLSSAQQATAGFVATTCSLDRMCEKLPTPLPAKNFRAVWGTSASNVWVAGTSGTLMHWDGAMFMPVPSGTMSDLLSIWGTSANDFWVGASAGLVLHWNGTAFTQMNIGSAQGVSGIWGSSANDVWFLDGSPTLLRWDGSAFTANNTMAGTALLALWGSSATDMWVVGNGGKIVHWVGAGFATVASGTTGLLTGVWGSGPTDVWAVSGIGMSGFASVLHYDGASWSTITNNTIGQFLSGVSGSVSDAWVVGTNGAVYHGNGATFVKLSTGITGALNAAWSSGANDLWAVGDNGVILRHEM